VLRERLDGSNVRKGAGHSWFSVSEASWALHVVLPFWCGFLEKNLLNKVWMQNRGDDELNVMNSLNAPILKSIRNQWIMQQSLRICKFKGVHTYWATRATSQAMILSCFLKTSANTSWKCHLPWSSKVMQTY
jgi:hypothetical protein